MDLFSKIEKLSEKYIEGFFKSKSSSHIQPIEIARHLNREMRDKRTISLSKIYVPNRYQIFISENDWDNISAFLTSLAQEMQEFILDKAKEKNYSLVSLPSVEILVDKSLNKGDFRIDSKFSDEPEETTIKENMEDTLVGRKNFDPIKQESMGETIVTQIPQLPKAEFIIHNGDDEGKLLPITEKAQLIGRKEDSDIILNDNNISRNHAKLESFLGEYFLTDLNSTNGTYVNGVKIERKKLETGDRIKMGITVLEFRVV